MSDRVAGDRIELRGLRVVGRCGVLPEEIERGQPLEVDLDVVTDMAAAGGSDDLADTVDYGAICTAVERAITDGHVQLLEFLAGKLADAVLAVDGRISAVEVAVRKLRPPVPQHLATSGVRVTRLRP
ncbi:MAG TPA: dihydroneopterin aldolase [Acidimicrobiales bacterium]|nr:dihydroneopterin aldolase [Acidimicrobiales bacterium]